MTRLLIVDDESEITLILNNLLQDYFSEIQNANDGREALELIQNNEYDAILSDVRMPRMSGLDLLTEIRDQGNMVPFIVMTGFSEDWILKEALRLGATDIVCKPFQSENMAKIILGCLKVP